MSDQENKETTQTNNESNDIKKNKVDFGNIFGTTINLVIFCFASAFLLSFFNQMTKDKILANEKKEIERVQKILLKADKYEKIKNFPKAVKALNKEGKVVGYIVTASPTGYGGKIKLMYSVSKKFKVLNVNIVSQTETPGLGDKIEETTKLIQFGNKPFVSQFKEKGINQIHIGSDKIPNDKSIAAITGSTVSSTAVTKGIHDTLEKLKNSLKNENADSISLISPNKKKLIPSFKVYAAEIIPSSLKILLKGDQYKKIYSKAYKVIKKGKIAGYIVMESAQGYNDKINVGFSLNKKLQIINIKVIYQNDSPGYGEQIEKQSFLSQFIGKNIKTLKFTKDCEPSKDYVVAVTGATISSRGVFEATKKGIIKLQNFLKIKNK